ncbi:DUF2218 domain-containing protein, partial [Vibrio parahaemolyticus]
ADSEKQLEQVKGIIESHVEMFSRRETLELDWIR